MSPGNGCEEFMTDWSVVCAGRKLTARHRRDVAPQINKLCINISSSKTWDVLSSGGIFLGRVVIFLFFFSSFAQPPLYTPLTRPPDTHTLHHPGYPPPAFSAVFLKALCSCNSFHLMTLLGLQRVTTNWLPGRARTERRETQADSHVIIICLMMCGGGTRREEYWNKSMRDTKK